MLATRILIFVSTILMCQAINYERLNFSPYDLLDDAKAEIENLSQIVLGNILVAHSDLQDLQLKLTSDAINIRLEAEVHVEEERQTLEQQLENLKLLAWAAQKNISVCLEGNEDKLIQLPKTVLEDISNCVSNTTEESDSILKDANYNVDIVFNKVHSLSFALGQCAVDDEDCIQNVINSTKSAEANLPLEIQAVVSQAENDMEIVTVKVQICSENGVAGYVKDAGKIFGEISDCINQILS